MVDDRLKTLGLTAIALARLTGQDPNTVRRKLRGDQGLALGPREAGILACLRLMTADQRAALWAELETVLLDLRQPSPPSSQDDRESG